MARAHVLALKSAGGGTRPKRLLISKPGMPDVAATLEILREKRPKLEGRLTTQPVGPNPIRTDEPDKERIMQVLGLDVEAMIPWEDTLLDAVDCLLKLE